MSFPDIELALMDYLDDLGFTVTATPLDLQDHLAIEPVIRIQRVSGEDDHLGAMDFPNVIIQVYAMKDPGDPRAAHDVSEAIRDRLNTINDGGVFVSSQNAMLCFCQTISGPIELTYLDPAVSVFQTGHRISTKGR